MGVQARVTLYATRKADALAGADAAFRRMADLEAVMSDYRDDSEVMRLCARAGGPEVPVSRDLLDVVERSLDFARASGGAFDVTVGPVVKLWRRARREQRLPDPAELVRARGLVGWRLVETRESPPAVRLLRPGMQLDFGGIGKGFAADAARDALRARGLSRCLIDLGGDLVAGEPPPGRSGWRVRIGGDGPVLSLRNQAVATSGDTEQFVEIDGVRYSHIVDPATGLGLTNRLRVTVLAPTGTAADALASAASVLGEARGRSLLATQPGVRGYFGLPVAER